MDQTVANAPRNQFSRKSYFWSRVKALRQEVKLPAPIDYKYMSAADVEAEYIRLKRIVDQRVIAKQAQQLQKVKAVRKSKVADVYITSINKAPLKIKNISDFFTNPINNAVLDVTHIPIRTVIPYIHLRQGFSLILQAGNNSYAVNNDNIHKIVENLKGNIVDVRQMNGSDAEIISAVGNPDIQVSFVWRSTGRRRPNGGYFKYYNKLDKIDLSRYGIYRNENETDKYELNCLEIALINGGISKDKVNKIKTMIKTRYVPQKDLKTIAEHLKINIVLSKVYNDQRKNYSYGNKQHDKINIGLYDEHYFLIEKTNYTSFSIKNYFEVHDKENFNKIYKKRRNMYLRNDKKAIDSFDIVKMLLGNKETHLTEINMTNCGKYSNYSKRSFDYETLPEIGMFEAEACLPKELMKPKIFIDSDAMKHRNKEEKEVAYEDGYDHKIRRANIKDIIYLPYEYLYFDTETTTDEDQHKPYMICSETRYEQKQCHIGNNCILQWLQSLDKNYVCVAHNLRYDLQFIVKYLDNMSDMIKTGNKIKSISGEFRNKNTGKVIKLHFKDSYGIITMPLKKFGSCFNLDVKKEIMPYEIYNKDTINKPLIDFQEAEQYLSKTDYIEFIKNINEWKLVKGNKFDHIEYAKIYCEMDVIVLRKGYETFRSWMQEVCSLDIDYAVSIPQLANAYGLNRNVFEGCYKISSVARDFIQKCVVGGRCMTRNNEKFKINHDVDDFDGVSLYPSAMNRIDGFLKGKPKVWNSTINLNKVDGYFVEIEVEDLKIERDFPLLSRKNDEGIRNFSNDIRGSNIFVDKIGLEDLIRFQGIKYKILRGYYFDEGRNDTIKSFMKELFEERLIKKKAKNPVQEVYKLIMNSFYGKLIMKPIDSNHNFIYGKEAMDKHLSYRFNSIIEYTKITDGLFIVKESKSIMDHFSMPHCGSEVLSMSKRIMNEVMCLAEDMNIEIYYQDTDSMHIDARLDNKGKSGVEKLSAEYFKLYGKELVGKNLGQFHSDFDYKSDEQPISVESIYL